MTFRQFFLLLFLATLLLTGGWAWSLFSINPLTTNWLGFVLFYFTFFFAATGWFCIFGVAIRRWRHPDAVLFYSVARSFRQSIALSFLLLMLLALQGERLLAWWNILILTGIVVLIETIALRFHDRQRPAGSTRRPSYPSAHEEEPLQPMFRHKEVQDHNETQV